MSAVASPLANSGLRNTTDSLIDPESARLNDYDHQILGEVAKSLENGRQLRAWWERTDAAGTYENKFSTAMTLNRPDKSFAFLDHATLNGKKVPVMGDTQEMFYDNVKMSPDEPLSAKAAAVESTRAQLQEYILRYYARTSSSALPKYFDPGAPTPPDFLNPLGLCPRREGDRAGFGQKQLYYKTLDGRIGKFHKQEQETVIDFREIGTRYQWMVGDARMFGFQFSYMPLGPNMPHAEWPLRESQLAVISQDFITNKTYGSDSEIVGEYGYGLATLRSPVDTTVVGYGPGFFDFGFATYTWQIHSDGTIGAKMVFCVNQPDIVINPALNPISYGIRAVDQLTGGMATAALDRLPRTLRSLVDPVFASIAVANLATFGLAARELNVSQTGVMKLFLYYHYVVIYMLVANSVMTWRQIPDWLDAENLPDWVKKGTGGLRVLRPSAISTLPKPVEQHSEPHLEIVTASAS